MSVTHVMEKIDEFHRHPDHVPTNRAWSWRSSTDARCVVARVEGELDAVLHDEFRTLLDGCGAADCRIAVLDLRAVTFMSIRAAVLLAERSAVLELAGIDLRVVSGRKEIERVLTLAGVRPRCRGYATMSDAIAG